MRAAPNPSLGCSFCGFASPQSVPCSIPNPRFRLGVSTPPAPCVSVSTPTTSATATSRRRLILLRHGECLSWSLYYSYSRQLMDLYRLVRKFDNEDMYMSRFRYIRDIANGLYAGPRGSFPTAIQGKLLEDALHHLVCAISDEIREAAQFRGTTPSCCMKGNRKDVLKEIHGLLLFLQRERLYDPPADDEIGYYLLIQRYIRSIITFFVPGPEIELVYVGGDDDKIDCYAAIPTMLHLQELSELNRHLADLSVFVSEADIRNGPPITPLMGINEKIDVHPLIKGSEERSNAFYLHKFRLAELDLRSTEFSHCPPLDEEKILYVQLLDDLALCSSVAVEEVNVFSDLLCCLFLERIERESKDLERHCKRIKDVILEKLSLTERYESILEQFKLETKKFKSEAEDLGEEYDPKAIDLTDIKRKLAQSCGVSANDQIDYVRCVDQYQHIAVNVAVFITSRLSNNKGVCEDIDDCLRTGRSTKQAGWELLHALTLLKQGRFLFGTVLQEHSIVWKKRARMEFQQEVKCMQKCGPLKEDNDNLKILRGVIEGLRYVGSLNAKTDEEEEQHLLKIWHNVASSIHFFMSAMAYEQRHYINNCGGLRGGRIPGMRTTRRKRDITVADVQCRLPELADEVANLSFILATLREGLLEKMVPYAREM